MPPMPGEDASMGRAEPQILSPCSRSTTSKRGCSLSGVRSSTLPGHNRTAPGSSPEQINHNNPPSYCINEVFRTGESRQGLRQATRRQSDSPRQRLVGLGSGLPRNEGFPQHDPHALSGDPLFPDPPVDSLELPGIPDPYACGTTARASTAPRAEGAWSRRPSACWSTRPRTASGRNSPRPRQDGSSRTPLSSSFSSSRNQRPIGTPKPILRGSGSPAAAGRRRPS